MPSVCFESASELTRRMACGELSVTEVVAAHLSQIERVNPAVNAICTLAADSALARAAWLDQRFEKEASPKALYGLPVGIKDLVETRGLRTTYGSPIYRDHVPVEDSAVVSLLRNAGAVVIGKTNTPEFGAGSQTFNTLFGRTRNPYDLSLTCGGSSGGSAVALATGMVAIADGTDFGGSLRNPASFCHVVGLRPSPGKVPQWPNRDPWNRLSVSGPMGRSVDDVARLFSVMAQPDARDPLSVGWVQKQSDLSAHPTIAWSPTLGGAFPVDKDVLVSLAPAMHRLESIGCVVEEAEPDLAEAGEVFEILRGLSYVVAHASHWRNHRGELKDTIVWNVEQGLKLTAERIAWAESTRAELFERMRRFLCTYDFLVLPSVQVLPFDVDTAWVTQIGGQTMSSYIDWMKSCSMISVTEHPALSLPAGRSAQGLPVGLQIVGRYQQESSLLELGRRFEDANPDSDRWPAVAQRS